MSKRSIFRQLLIVTALSLTPIFAVPSAFALQSVYRQDEARNPAATQWAPKRFGYSPSPQVRYLPGTAKAKRKCIPNGQARCMPQMIRNNPFFHAGMPVAEKPTRSGVTASPIVKTFNFDDYLSGGAQ